MTTTISETRLEQQITSVRLVDSSNVVGTYSNGPSNNGIGATLTTAASTLTIDSVAVVNGDSVLLNGQTAALQNGIYVVSGVGTTVVLTRRDDFQNIEQMIPGYYIPVSAGTVYGGAIFGIVEPQIQAVGVDSVTFRNISNSVAAVTTSSATPGTLRALTGTVTESATTMTSGNLVGVRGAVTLVGASGGFLYGTQGKVIATGTLSGSSWTAGVFGQLDISAATINAGQTAALWGDYGTSSGTITDGTGMRGVAMTNTTAAVLNAQDYRYGNATYLLELAGAGGTLNYYAAAGTSAGSAGDAAHCAAQQVIKIEINGVAAYIPVFTQNT
jgi:hypothetical protein